MLACFSLVKTPITLNPLSANSLTSLWWISALAIPEEPQNINTEGSASLSPGHTSSSITRNPYDRERRAIRMVRVIRGNKVKESPRKSKGRERMRMRMRKATHLPQCVHQRLRRGYTRTPAHRLTL
jgi:hypothetical protein